MLYLEQDNGIGVHMVSRLPIVNGALRSEETPIRR